jgi:ferrous iron transport protein B
MPSLRAVLQKAWFRGREFIFEAWPVLIIGSLIFSIMTYFNLEVIFNALLLPLSWLLGLPSQVGVPLVFGILRKELSLIMLRQALGFVDFGVALTPVQMITYTVFVVFYIPCLATLTVLKRELGKRDMLTIAGLTVLIATLAAFLARVIASLIY